MLTNLLDGEDENSQKYSIGSLPHSSLKSGALQDKISHISTESQDRRSSLIQYSIELRKGFEFIRERNYLSSRNCYRKCYEIASTILDRYKQVDSLINIGICDFYNGEFSQSIIDLESASKVYSSTKILSNNPIQVTHLGIKLLCNLSISYLTILKTSSAIDSIEGCINLIKKESPDKQLSLLRSAAYILFRVESLVLDIDAYNDNKIISHILKGFQAFLRDGDYNHLLTTFKEATERYKEIKDMNGYYFSLFYQYVSLYNSSQLSENKINEIKKKIEVCNKYLIGKELSGDVSEKEIHVIMKEFDEKAQCAIKIFRMIYDFENELRKRNTKSERKTELNRTLDKSHLFTNEKVTSPVFIQLLLKYALKYIREENSESPTIQTANLLNELNILMKKISNMEIETSSIKLTHFDPSITNALKQVFDNLIYIYYKSMLKDVFELYAVKTKKLIVRSVNDRIKQFFVKKFQAIRVPMRLQKINYTSSGVKPHYYKIDSLTETFQIRNKLTDKVPTTSINLVDGIIKVTYGISSQNIKKKVINDNKEIMSIIQYPWRIISLVTPSRTIDLFCSEEQVNQWFYGLSYYYNDTNVPCRIISSGKFLLTKLKLKIIFSFKQEDNFGEYEDVINDLINEKGIQNFSFVKIFLLYNKVFKLVDK